MAKNVNFNMVDTTVFYFVRYQFWWWNLFWDM